MEKAKNSFLLVFLLAASMVVFTWPAGISAKESIAKKDVKKEMTGQKNPYVNVKITVKIIPSVKKTFGYDIFVEGKPFIHQTSIPAMPGNEGFATREKAHRVADFVVGKIRNNVMPPAVTMNDLIRMDALK
mgnify:CR=1 FL=1